MPKSYEEIMKHADELSAYMEQDFVGVETPEEAALKAAAYRRARAEADVLEAVKDAAAAGRSWRSIGEALGTTGEATRYSALARVPRLVTRTEHSSENPSRLSHPSAIMDRR